MGATFTHWLSGIAIDCPSVELVPTAVNVMGLPASVPELALTVLVPAADPKVRILEANPEASVATVVFEIVPPPPVAAKTTLTPLTGVPPLEDTLTVSGALNGVPAVPV